MIFTVVFPMAGQGARFGGTFKPFLRYGDELFIEAAVRPFRHHLAEISRLVFVFLREQDEQSNASAELARRFAGLPVQIVLLDRPTRGPAETVATAARQAGLAGPVMICDCDHSLDVAPLFAAPPAACTLPTWSLEGERVEAWSIACVGADGRVLGIAEKRHPQQPGDHRGVIGCYVFGDLADVVRRSEHATNFSDVIRQYLAEGRDVRGVAIEHAELFGDPARLADALSRRAAHAESS